jgi:hypothetical protein
LQLFHWTDGSTTFDSNMAEIDAYLKQQAVIEFLVAESEMSASVHNVC